jgi:ubiquinone/menaquinone biosynthesis C-methylase UbiE
MHDPSLVFEEMRLKAGDVFLDLGCGPGEYSIHASRLVGKSGLVYSLDRSELSISELIQRAGEDGITNITAMVADLTEPLPIKETGVDVCLVATVLHIPDVTSKAGALCDEIRRVLKPDGRLVIIDCHKDDLSFGPPKHMRLSPEEVKELVGRYGFVVLSEVDLGYNYMIQFAVE